MISYEEMTELLEQASEQLGLARTAALKLWNEKRSENERLQAEENGLEAIDTLQGIFEEAAVAFSEAAAEVGE